MQVGIDTVEIKRIEALTINKERFIERVFSLKEQQEFREKNNKSEHIAAAFSAKEAFSKALGTGVSGFKIIPGFADKDISNTVVVYNILSAFTSLAYSHTLKAPTILDSIYFLGW